MVSCKMLRRVTEEGKERTIRPALFVRLGWLPAGETVVDGREGGQCRQAWEGGGMIAISAKRK